MARVNLGMFVHNEERHLAEAIASLLQQTHRDFRLIVLNDRSTDGTEAIIRMLAAGDDRVGYHYNDVRRGYGANYRLTFDLRDADCEYFAWAAGHDRHHPEWLAEMVAALDADDSLVMAYPLTARIGDCGEPLAVPPPRFDSVGLGHRARIRSTCNAHGYGNMIYGLFRVPALLRAGVFRPYLLPDTLLLCELSLQGAVRQVSRELWFRRFADLFSLPRQRRNVFAHAPWYVYIHYSLVNSWVLAWHAALKLSAGPPSRRSLGLYLAWCHFQRFFIRGEIRSRLARADWLRAIYRLLAPRGAAPERR